MSARLLLLTMVFVMVAEVLIYVPSIARFRKTYLEERLARSHLATLALEDAPDWALGRTFGNKLLHSAEVHGIVVHRGDARILMIERDMPPHVDRMFDLRDESWWMWVKEAFNTLSQRENRVLRVVGPVGDDPRAAIEVVMDESPMREAMYSYSTRILQLSIVISLITAGLLYLSLRWMLIRPIQRITASMVDFRRDPEGEPAPRFPDENRSDEIGLAQHELAVMQNELRAALRQKSRLAALGAAVAKVNHDLRNSLATAVLVSDHLANVDDPQVKQVLPRLYTAVDRAVELCSQTLEYARDPASVMRPTLFHLHELVAEVGIDIQTSDLGVKLGNIAWINDVAPDLAIDADRMQFFRVLKNLGRNAYQAEARRCVVSAHRDGGIIRIDISDNGRGMPQKARDHLFEPFAGSVRAGGTGLGLVIANEIVKAHKGSIALLETSESGTRFRIELPAPGHSEIESEGG